MNAFAACLVLSQMSSDQFLSLMPQERTERFGQLLGAKRMVRTPTRHEQQLADDTAQVELNRALEQSAAALSSSLPASDLRDSSSTQL